MWVNDNAIQPYLREKPVDIETFISDPKYLGNSTGNGKHIWEFWKEKLKLIFEEDEHDTVVFNTAIGVGKTKTACICMLYQLHCLMCLNDPQAFFYLTDSETIYFAFLQPTLTNSLAYNTCIEYISKSPWFLEHGEIVGESNRNYISDQNIRFKICSTAEHLFGTTVFSAYADIKNKKIQRELITLACHTSERIRSRFYDQGETVGKLFIDNTCMWYDDPITKLAYSVPCLQIRGAQWDIKPCDWFQKDSIMVIVNKLAGKSRVHWNIHNAFYCKHDEDIIHVPKDFEYSLKVDLDTFLRDIANIDLTQIETDVPFPAAMHAMLQDGKAINMPGYDARYYVERGLIVDHNHVPINLSSTEYFTKFVECNNWEVRPVEYLNRDY